LVGHCTFQTNSSNLFFDVGLEGHDGWFDHAAEALAVRWPAGVPQADINNITAELAVGICCTKCMAAIMPLTADHDGRPNSDH